MSSSDNSDEEPYLVKYPRHLTPVAIKNFTVSSQDTRDAGTSDDFIVRTTILPHNLREQNKVIQARKSSLNILVNNNKNGEKYSQTFVMPEGENVSDTKKIICIFCKDVIKNNSIKCNKCSTYVHIKCFEQVAKYFVVEKLNWRCRSCIKNEEMNLPSKAETEDINIVKENYYLKREIELLKKLVAEQEYVNSLQKGKIEYILQKSASATSTNDQSRQSASYSNVLKMPVLTSKEQKYNVPHSSHSLLIKSSRESVNNADVVNDIKNNINLADLNICVTNIKAIKNGVLVNCENKTMLDKLKMNLHEKIGDKYAINEATKYKPRLKIKNVEKDSLNDNNNNFLNDLIIRNNLSCQLDDIKIIFKQTEKYSANVVIEVLPSIRKIIISKGYLFIGWKKCEVADHYSVTRCFKCSRYGHIKGQCKSETVCVICAGNHELKNCHAQFKKCTNCVNYNSRHKTNVSVDHTAKDANCHVFKLVLEKTISKTNFND